MDRFIELVDGFHDALTKEMHVINRAYIDSSRGMHMDQGLHGQFLLQSQGRFDAIELLFLGISSLTIGGGAGYYEDASGSVGELITLRLESGFEIQAAELHYRLVADGLGIRARFGAEVPDTEMKSAILLEPNWRQCSVCANAWEERDDVEFSRCPECETLTELKKKVDAEPSQGAYSSKAADGLTGNAQE